MAEMLSPETAPPPPAPPEKRVWGFWPTAGFSAAILLTFIAVQVIVSLIVFSMRLGASGLGLDEALEKLKTDGFTLSIAVIASVIAGSALVAVFARLKGVPAGEYLGFNKLNWKIILLSIVVFGVMLALVSLAGSYLGDTEDAEFSAGLYRSSIFPPLLWLAVVLVGPFFEEIFFRGFLFVGLKASRVGVIATVFSTSLIWAALHLQYNLFGIGQILVMGLVLGTVRHRTESLWSPLIIHMLWNGAAMLATALYVNSGGA